MIATPPVQNHVQNDIAAVVYRDDAMNSGFWKQHSNLFPEMSGSLFWTRERQFIQLTEATHRAKTFKQGWDGYDAPTPNDVAIARTLKALSALRGSTLNPYSVLPSADGGIGVSFRGDNNKRAVLELLNDGTASYMLYGRGYPTQSSEFDLNADLPRILQRLLEYL